MLLVLVYVHILQSGRLSACWTRRSYSKCSKTAQPCHSKLVSPIPRYCAELSLELAEIARSDLATPTSPFTSVEHRLIHGCYPSSCSTARSLLWAGALGNWLDEACQPQPSVYGETQPHLLADMPDPEGLQRQLQTLKTRWKREGNMVGAMAKLLAGDGRGARQARQQFGLEGECRKLPTTYHDAWRQLKLGLKRKYCLPELTAFRRVLLRRDRDGKLPILVEQDAKARERQAFWAGVVHEGRLYGKNACGLLLSKVRAALLWDAVKSAEEVQDEQLKATIEVAQDAEDLYLAGLGYVKGEGSATCGMLSHFDSPIPDSSYLKSLGLKQSCRYERIGRNTFARDLARIEQERSVVYFRSSARMPWCLLSNFAYVPWGA